MTPNQTTGFDHGGIHPQCNLPPISQKLALRNEQIKPAPVMRRRADAPPRTANAGHQGKARRVPELTMFRNIQTLVAIQEHVLRWRRLATEVTNPQTARRLRDLADEMEVRARELDRQ